MAITRTSFDMAKGSERDIYRTLLKCFKVPSDSVQSVEVESYEEPCFKAPSNEEILFNTECIQSAETFAERQMPIRLVQ